MKAVRAALNSTLSPERCPNPGQVVKREEIT